MPDPAPPAPTTWRLRCRTIEAAIGLMHARALIIAVPFRYWNSRLGLGGRAAILSATQARRLAAHVERAARRVPFSSKCLPRAIALGTMLRRRGIPHRLVLAARPSALRRAADDLHAWIEVDGKIVLGDIPGPWLTVLALPQD